MVDIKRKCDCGAELKTATENIRLDVACPADGVRKVASGLDVALIGVPVFRCASCGFVAADLTPRQCFDLEWAVGAALIEKGARLTAKEIRFLRTRVLYYKSAQLARLMGVAPEVVSRWENKGDIGAMADRALRFLVNLRMLLMQMPGTEVDKADHITVEIADTSAESKLRLQMIKNVGWTVVEP